MDPIIAFCGLDCSECSAYVATQAGDRTTQEQLLDQWKVEYNSPEMTIEAVICDGCTSAQGRHGGYCAACPVRACGVQHGVENCAYCAEYETCQTLHGFISQIPGAKARLDLIRSQN